MKIKKKQACKIEPTNNKHGLDLNDFYNLQSGKTIEINLLPDSLRGKVEIIKDSKKKGK
jgi:hypothetical protein|tara:strand:+ start:838 stop:1014 length:177 start_codon:yes stop_codon:yes gene_type:complete